MPSRPTSICTRSAVPLAAVAATLALPASALADPPLRLRVGTNSLVLPASLLTQAPDVDPARTVTLRGSDGATTTEQRGGTSAAQLLAALGIPADGLAGLEIQSGRGKTVTISGDEVRGGFGGDPACATCEATFDLAPGGDTARFFRPLRGPGDANRGDALTPDPKQTLFVGIADAKPTLLLNARTNRVAPQPRQRVSFSVEAFGNPAGTRYTWFFGDGTTDVGKTVTHKYDAGNWPVGVLATAPGAYGASSLVLRVADSEVDDEAPPKEQAPVPTTRPTTRPQVTVAPAAPPAATAAPAAPGTAGTSPGAALAPPVSPPPEPSPSPTPAPAQAGLVPVSGLLISPETIATPVGGAPTDQPQSSTPASPPPADDPGPQAMRSATSGMLLASVLFAGALTERRRARRALLP